MGKEKKKKHFNIFPYAYLSKTDKNKIDKIKTDILIFFNKNWKGQYIYAFIKNGQVISEQISKVPFNKQQLDFLEVVLNLDISITAAQSNITSFITALEFGKALKKLTTKFVTSDDAVEYWSSKVKGKWNFLLFDINKNLKQEPQRKDVSNAIRKAITVKTDHPVIQATLIKNNNDMDKLFKTIRKWYYDKY